MYASNGNFIQEESKNSRPKGENRQIYNYSWGFWHFSVQDMTNSYGFEKSRRAQRSQHYQSISSDIRKQAFYSSGHGTHKQQG